MTSSRVEPTRPHTNARPNRKIAELNEHTPPSEITLLLQPVREGRRIYDNLRKSIVFLLPTNGAQSLVILVAVLFGLTLPLTSVQVLWVNMVTAVTLSLALAYEPAERGIMRRPPRPSG